MKNNFTPGPWAWCGNDLDGDDYQSVLGAEVSCSAFCYGGCVSLEISAADRVLIAAAPDLLAALQMVGESAGFQYMVHETRDAISAAIAKATGGET